LNKTGKIANTDPKNTTRKNVFQKFIF